MPSKLFNTTLSSLYKFYFFCVQAMQAMQSKKMRPLGFEPRTQSLKLLILPLNYTLFSFIINDYLFVNYINI